MSGAPPYADPQGRPLDIGLVVDTNVIVQIVSPFDLHREIVAHQVNPNVGPVMNRLAQIRGSVRLALYCHENAITTLSTQDEQFRIIKKEASASVPFVFASVFAYFVRQRLLSGWRTVYDVDHDAGLKGNASDDALLAHAIKSSRPLITREGSKKKSLRAKASDAGALALSPEEFLSSVGFSGGVLEDAAHRFLRRFDEKKLDYAIDQLAIERHHTSLSIRQQERVLVDTIKVMRSFYEGLLLARSPLLGP